ncbi:hypothetical protein [Dryocola sp. LX212]
MKLTQIIAAVRERVPDFGGRVDGSAKFMVAKEAGKMALPSAYIIPLHDETGVQKSQTDYWQNCTDGFSVVVALDNRRDEKGLNAIDDATDIVRTKLFRALLGWQPERKYTRGIEYRGGLLLDMDRAILWYKYDFQATFELDAEDTWQDGEIDNLPWLETVHIDIDLIDPGNGPDGNTDFQVDIHLPHDPTS